MAVLIRHLIIPVPLERRKTVPVFEQRVHVAIASASLLHLPVSQRQMNGNDCFVLLCRRLLEMRKTYISHFHVCGFVTAESAGGGGGRKRERARREIWNGFANSQRFFFSRDKG